jgi:hypothetical protein
MTYEGAAHPTSLLDTIIRSTSKRPAELRMMDEEEQKLAHLEKRLVANVDFDNQALHILGFGTDIYYMLGHLGWVRFSNGGSANTHKEFALEIVMTMVRILDEGVLSLILFGGSSTSGPYEYIRGLLGFQKGAPELVDEQEGMLDSFWNMITRGAHQKEVVFGTPSSKCFTHGCARGFWGE